MEPFAVIVWIGVAVFAGASVIALLELSGIRKATHGRLLIGTLITQIVVAGCGAFVYQLKKSQTELKLPVSDLMIVEQASHVVVYDNMNAIYVRSADVSRANRFADLVFDSKQDFSTATPTVRVVAGTEAKVEIEKRKFRVWFSRMGTLDPDPKEKQSRSSDFVFLSIEREK